MNRNQNCCMCAKPVEIEYLDSTHSEAPTMWRMKSPEAWCGVILVPDDEPERIVTCSERCTKRLLEEQAS